jgi:hypothetical protein
MVHILFFRFFIKKTSERLSSYFIWREIMYQSGIGYKSINPKKMFERKKKIEEFIIE